MQSRCVLGSEDLHFFNVVPISAGFQPSHNENQSNDDFINNEKTTSSLSSQPEIGEDLFEQLIDESSLERLIDALKNDGINPDGFNDIPNEVNQSRSSASEAENPSFEGSLEFLDESTTQRFFQEIQIERFESNQNPIPKINKNFHIADYCLIVLLSHENSKDPWIIWKDQSKLIFQIPSNKKEKVCQKWYEIKGNKSEKGCYKYFRQSIRYAINKSRDFEKITGKENFGQNLIFKFGERFKSRIFTLDCLNPTQMKIYKMILNS